jgi:hypothetical protein
MPEAGAAADRLKDQANECELFKPRVTVARDAARQPPQRRRSAAGSAQPNDARAAFDNLFKKPE